MSPLKIQERFSVDAPPELVWDYLIDPARMASSSAASSEKHGVRPCGRAHFALASVVHRRRDEALV